MKTSPPPTIGQTLEHLLRKVGLNQTEAAQKIGISRQYLNSVINGKFPLTVDLQWKLEPIIRQDTDFWDNVKREYDFYLTTSDGRRQFVESRGDELATRWDLVGPRRLVNHEIQYAVESGVIILDKQTARTGEQYVNAFDKQRLKAMTYTLSVGPSLSILKTNGRRQTFKDADTLYLEPKESVVGTTLERLTLGGRISAAQHAVEENLEASMLDLRTRRIIPPWNNSGVSYRIVNEGSENVPLSIGTPLLEITFDYLGSAPSTPDEASASDTAATP
jgi:addiction module HigA family antidote